LNLSAQPIDSLHISHNFSIGVGYMQMMSSGWLPFGLPAVNLSTDYQYFKMDRKHNNNYWGYWLKSQFAFLQIDVPNKFSIYQKYYLSKYYRTEIKTGGVWLRKIPIKSDKFRLFIGAGVSLNTEFNFTRYHGALYYNFPDLNWFLSPDLHIRAEYNFKKIILKGEILLPIVQIGNYLDKYGYLPVNPDVCSILKYKFTPNTFVFLNKIFQPNITISAKIPLNENNQKQWFFLIKYAFESLDVNLKNFTEKKEQHDLRIGFICEM